jgi:hypothetical protein
MQQRHGGRPFGSLTAHLLEAGDHGRLGFHPRCPVCRKERLFGSLSSEPLISRRVQAALATGVLAFSAAAPGAAVAAVPDRQKEGVAAPGPRSGGNLDSPDFDPGGETALPFEVAPTPTSPVVGGDSEDTGDGPPVDSDPVVDLDAHLLAPTTPETQPPTETDAPVPPAEVAPVSPAPPTRERVIIEAPPADAETPSSPNAPDAAPRSEPEPKQEESDRRRRAPSETSAPAEPPQAPPIGVAPQSPPPGSPLPAAAVADTVPWSKRLLLPRRASDPSRRPPAGTSSSPASRSGRSRRGCSGPMPRRDGSLARSNGSGSSTGTGSAPATPTC